LNKQASATQEKAVGLLKSVKPDTEAQDTNYIFLHYIINQLPIGIVGFLIAMILLSSMGSMASAFGSLTSTSMVDIYERFIAPDRGNQHYWWISKLITLGWGVLCLVVAQFAVNMGSLIEVVNILGSWFYGTILGVFLCAFYLPRTTGTQVFTAALIAEAFVIYAWKVEWMAFLWLNVLGCLLVMAIALILSLISGPKQTSKTSPE
jgi:Na+/proline symporter